MAIEQISSTPELPVVLEQQGYIWSSQPGSRYLAGRLGVHKITNSHTGKDAVLKTATQFKALEPEQTQLLTLGQTTETPAIKLPKLEQVGTDWFLMEYINGSYLSQTIDKNAQTCIDLTWELAHWYQKLLEHFHSTISKRKPSEAETNWPFQKIKSWGIPMVKEGLISPDTLIEIEHAWQKLLSKYGESLYKHVHGNIHADHVIITPEGCAYILDPVDWIRPCPFDGAIYDWLRALDWMILKAEEPAKMFDMVIKNIQTRLSATDASEIRTFLALRGLGCIGGDILLGSDKPKMIQPERIQTLLRLVKGDF